MKNSRIPEFYKLNVSQRVAELQRLGWMSSAAAHQLLDGQMTLSADAADKMVENVIGVFGMPLAIVPNFVINGRDCLVPLVIEEPSVVAALSNVAALTRGAGGFTALCDESLLVGQIHLTLRSDADAALAAIRGASDTLVELANDVHPRLLERGGGVTGIEARSVPLAADKSLIIVHILVDTCDAMGANLVNSICEALAPRLAEITCGNVALRILSNLVDHSIVTAGVRVPCERLADKASSGEEVRDKIVLANDIALLDTHRAATHNKGIMNGIDALAIATGNDWRAIEAGAHAYAARNGAYSALTQWSVGDAGELVGEIRIALKAGIVGGTVRSNPAATFGLAIAAVESAKQLMELMAAVGLAQNLAALRALATIGIQKGHMRMHARSVAAAAGAPDHCIDGVVDELVAGGVVKTWKAEEILAARGELESGAQVDGETAAGKVILFGEHAVVYGRHGVALPIAEAVRASASEATHSTSLKVTDWGLETLIDRNKSTDIDAVINLILDELGVPESNVAVTVRTVLPRGMGLGSSAAIAVAIIRAAARHFSISIGDQRVNEIAFKCERIAHGTPSGIDNSISCFATPMLFRNNATLDIQPLQLREFPPLVIGFSHDMGLTRDQVKGVRSRYETSPKNYGSIFDQIDDISVQGATALMSQDYDELGLLMNVCHGLLNAIQVSTPDLERLVTLARRHGALGAKLTGAGGGGAIVALCPGNVDEVRAALNQAGYQTLALTQQRSKEIV